MDTFSEYSSALEELVMLPTVLSQRLKAIDMAEKSVASDLEREQREADQSVEDSRHFVAGVLKDARDVLSAIDQAALVPPAVRAGRAATGDSHELKAALGRAGEGVRQAVIAEQRRRRDEEASERATAAEAEQQRLEAERLHREKLERDRLETERRARQKELLVKAAAIAVVLVAIAVLLTLIL